MMAFLLGIISVCAGTVAIFVLTCFEGEERVEGGDVADEGNDADGSRP